MSKASSERLKSAMTQGTPSGHEDAAPASDKRDAASASRNRNAPASSIGSAPASSRGYAAAASDKSDAASASRNGNAPATPSTRQLVRWLTAQTRPVHKPLYVSTCFRILTLSLDILLFALAAGGIASILTEGASVAKVLGILVAIALVKASSYYFEQLTGHYVAFKALELLRTLVFSQLWPKAPAVVHGSRSGDVLASLTRDVDRIEVVYAHTFSPVVSALVVPPAFVIATGIAFGWGTALVPAICVVLGLFVVPFLGLDRSMAATHRTLELRRDLSHHATDSVFGVEEVVGYGRADERLAQMDELGEQIGASAAIARRSNGIRRGGNLLLTIVSVIGVAYGAMSAGHSVVIVAALAAGALRLFEGPRGVEDAAGYLDHSLAAARRLWEICHASAAVSDGPEELKLDSAPGVDFTNLAYAYPDSDVEVLGGVSFGVRPGGHIVLVGPSGSGKSTAVNMLLRYDDPLRGEISVNGTPVDRYTLNSLRRNVVVVSQKNQLLNASIRDNATLGAPNASDEEIWAALATAGLAGEIRGMPWGLDTPVGQGGSQLSGGQAQRLCLARALLMKPRVLVLDEFSAQLNTELEAKVRAALAKLGVTIVEITHRLESVVEADSVVLMDRGVVVASGTLEEIVAHEGSVKEFFTRNV